MKNLILVFLFLFSLFQRNYSLTFTQLQNFTVPNSGAFGSSFFLTNNGDDLFIGAFQSSNQRGFAYIYQLKSGLYSYVQPFNNLASTVEYFGCSLAIGNNNYVIGSYGDDIGTGSVYVYSLSGSVFSLVQTLTAINKAVGDNFGYSVAISGNTLAVGAPGRNSFNGAVFLFTYSSSSSSWTQTAEIDSPYSGDGHFGYSLAFVNNVLVVGAPLNGATVGYVAIYNVAGGQATLVQNLTNSNISPGANFGWAIAFDGTTIAVSAYLNAQGTAVDVGAVFIFTYQPNSWVIQSIIRRNPQNPTGTNFGQAISLYAETLVVSTGTDHQVQIYVGSGPTWTLSQTISTNDTNSVAFGDSLLVVVDTLLIGDPKYVSANTTGFVWVYTRPTLTTGATTALLTTDLLTTSPQITASQTTKSSSSSYATFNQPSFFLFFILSFLFLARLFN